MRDPAIGALVREHIAETQPEAGVVEFSDGTSLVETGLLDSLAVFSLVGFLESRFGIEIRDQELVWANFETVAAVARLVESKLATAETR